MRSFMPGQRGQVELNTREIEDLLPRLPEVFEQVECENYSCMGIKSHKDASKWICKVSMHWTHADMAELRGFSMYTVQLYHYI